MISNILPKLQVAGTFLLAGLLAGSPQHARGDVSPGEKVLADLNCTACHKAPPAVQARLAMPAAPRLGRDGARISPNWVRSFLINPAAQVPGTTMPDQLHSLSSAEKAEAAEAISHYLGSLRTPESAPLTSFNVELANLGESLFHSVGCVACHAPQELPPKKEDHTLAELAKLQAGSAPLAKLSEKYALDDLADFLVDPVKFHPGGRMPSQRLTKVEARSLAFYLLKDLAGPVSDSAKESGVAFDFYNGNFGQVPDFEKLKPVTSGRANKFSIASGPQKNQMALRFRGFLVVPKSGDYSFWLSSDDGGKLWIDNQLVADNDGVHPNKEAQGRMKLTAGDHVITVGYFDSGGDRELNLAWSGPGLPRQEITSTTLYTTGGRTMRPGGGGVVIVDPAKAEKGKKLYAQFNCGACHGLEEPLTTKAEPFEQLANKGNRGCLSPKPESTEPAYSLTQSQRQELVSVLAKLPGLNQPLTAAEEVDRTMTSLNCFACHVRDGKGGPQGLRKEYFQVNGTADLGEEGVIPPHLNAAGAKLKPAWLEKVLVTGAFVRPYMATRMPMFGEANVKPLAAALLKADASSRTGPELKVETTMTKAGQRLVSTEGLSCITCHVFAGHPSLGVPALDITTASERLNSDWFRRYLLNPSALRPGTRMPSFFPEGVAVNKAFLNGDTEKQITAIWSYLAAGKSAALPSGLIPAKLELIARDEPIVYRNFIEGAGSRAIGVGYPEKVNLAFDANEMRLALLWQGPFIDASRHRTGRGEGFEPPLGYDVLKLPAAAPFAKLETSSDAWPKQTGKAAGYQFRGYVFNQERRPSFHYDFDGIAVQEFFLPVEAPGSTEVSFRRTLTLRSTKPASKIWFRAAVGDNIESKGNGAFVVDGQLRLAFTGVEPSIRKRDGKSELLIPVGFQNNAAEIVEEISW